MRLGPIRPDDHTGALRKRRLRRTFSIVLAVAAMSARRRLPRRSTARSRAPALQDVPLLHADTQPTRQRPDNPGGMQIPGQDTMVLRWRPWRAQGREAAAAARSAVAAPDRGGGRRRRRRAARQARLPGRANAAAGGCRRTAGAIAASRRRSPLSRRTAAAQRAGVPRRLPPTASGAGSGPQGLSAADRRRALARGGEARMGAVEAAPTPTCWAARLCRAARRSRRARHLLPHPGRADRRCRSGGEGLQRAQAARRRVASLSGREAVRRSFSAARARLSAAERASSRRKSLGIHPLPTQLRDAGSGPGAGRGAARGGRAGRRAGADRPGRRPRRAAEPPHWPAYRRRRRWRRSAASGRARRCGSARG